MWRLLILLCCSIFWLLAFPSDIKAEVSMEKYGIAEVSINSSTEFNQKFYDSALRQNMFMNNPYRFIGEGKEMVWVNRNFEFYCILFLFLFLGLIRLVDIRIFERMQNTLLHPAHNNSLYSEGVNLFSISGISLHVFACISMGTFLWTIIQWMGEGINPPLGPKTLWVLLVAVVFMVYLIKYFLLKISGWAFSLTHVFNQYSSQVLFMNKLLGIMLLPLSALLLFVPEKWTAPVFMMAIIVVIFVFILRYWRSWSSLPQNIAISRFHFFTYICAAEILPVLVILKIVLNGINQ